MRDECQRTYATEALSNAPGTHRSDDATRVKGRVERSSAGASLWRRQHARSRPSAGGRSAAPRRARQCAEAPVSADTDRAACIRIPGTPRRANGGRRALMAACVIVMAGHTYK